MRSFQSDQAVRKWGSLPRPVLAHRAGWVFSGSCASLLLLVLTGCATRLPEKAPDLTDRSTSSRSVVVSTPEAAINGRSGASSAIADSEPTPIPGTASATTLIAEEAAVAFCRPHLATQQWLNALRPLLTADAITAYATVLPSRIPCTNVIGPASAPLGDDTTRRIEVPTNAGMATVTVQRPGAAASWRVGRFVLPERR